ncbi:MAG: hypothetical protein F9K18_07160 [Thermoanaerobaculia bacterium]|nr:MAG: hypothetical protein F9K18_07160 [Thermoanaerobaculia bacterium]
MTRGRAVLMSLLFAFAAQLLARAAPAQVLSVDLSSDITFESVLGSHDHEAVLRLALPGPPEVEDLGSLPANADLTAFHRLDGGLRLFSLDTFVELPGGVVADRDDVVQYDGAGYAVLLDGSGAGLPDGARIDALGWRREGGVAALLLSTDVTVELPGGLVAEDEDVVAWDGAAWSLVLDGSAAGVADGLDLDGIDRDPVTGVLFVSFDGSGNLNGLDFDDDDALAWDGATWSLAFSGDLLGASFAAGDLDALGVLTSNIFRDGFESSDTIEWSAAVP